MCRQPLRGQCWDFGFHNNWRGPLASTGSPVDQRNKTVSEYTAYHEEQRLKTDNQTLINLFIENYVNLIRHTINVLYSYCIIRFLTMTTTVETSRSTCQRLQRPHVCPLRHHKLNTMRVWMYKITPNKYWVHRVANI